MAGAVQLVTVVSILGPDRATTSSGSVLTYSHQDGNSLWRGVPLLPTESLSTVLHLAPRISTFIAAKARFALKITTLAVICVKPYLQNVWLYSPSNLHKRYDEFFYRNPAMCYNSLPLKNKRFASCCQ